MEIFDCIQGSDEWFRVRMGIPTASQFDAVMANGRGGAPSKTRATYMYKLAGERLTGEPMYQYTNDHMERGKEMEDEARALYQFMTDKEVQHVGFIRNRDTGCSPDSLIVGHRGGLEIKTKLPHLQIEALLLGELPPEHARQVYGEMMVGELDWIDFFSYYPKMPPLLVRVHRDEKIIKDIAAAIDRFNDELNGLVHRLQNWQSADDDRLKLLQQSVSAS